MPIDETRSFIANGDGVIAGGFNLHPLYQYVSCPDGFTAQDKLVGVSFLNGTLTDVTNGVSVQIPDTISCVHEGYPPTNKKCYLPL